MYTPSVSRSPKRVVADTFIPCELQVLLSPSLHPLLPVPEGRVPLASSWSETGELTGKARTWIGCVSSTALKSCVIFWYQWGWREGHSRLAPIHTQAGHPFRFIINVNVFSSCHFIVSLFSGTFLWGPFGVLDWPPCFFIYHQVLCFSRLLAVAIPPRHCNSAQH